MVEVGESADTDGALQTALTEARGLWALRLPTALVESASADRLRRAILQAILERPLDATSGCVYASEGGSTGAEATVSTGKLASSCLRSSNIRTPRSIPAS